MGCINSNVITGDKKRKINHKEILIPVILFFAFFSMMYIYRNRGFFCDEGDNILGGMVVAKGGVIYRDFYSQHTPIMYYICGLFRILGASSIEQFRLFFYALLSLIWVLMYLRYNKYFGKLVMMIYPILFIVIFMSHVKNQCNTIVSGQVQAQAMIFLFLELLVFFKEKKISIPSAIVISLSIFVALGVTFMFILFNFI